MRLMHPGWLVTVWLGVACAGPSASHKDARPQAQVVSGKTPQGDPHGMALVQQAYARAGTPLPRHVRTPKALHNHAQAHGTLVSTAPYPGDVAFFSNTHDANADGKVDGGITQVALVERVEPDGTVVLVGHVQQGVLRFRMNTRHPTQRRDPATAKVWNHYLGRAAPGAPPRTAAQLFAGFARPHGKTAAPVLASSSLP